MNESRFYPMIGLMSGTSCDGLDIVAAYFTNFPNNTWGFEIAHAETVPFPTAMEKSLRECRFLPAQELAELDVSFGGWMGEQVKGFCYRASFQPIAVCSHGHTVFHQPERKLTLQIGNGWGIHVRSGYKVINDFRSLDVQLGGQGAPLVPIGDRLLFAEYEFCLNLGGIANISYEKKGQRIAYDLCPFNLLLNRYASLLGLPFDEGGQLAMQGTVHPQLLQELGKLPYYRQKGARSMGIELIENQFVPLIESFGLQIPDLLATLSEHFADVIAACITRESSDTCAVLCTGGGAYHIHFIRRLREKCKNLGHIEVPDRQIVDFKEALLFAFLGILKLENSANCLASVTGASRDNVGGTLYGF